MTPRELQLHLEDYGLDYVLDSLDLEPWYVVDLLINRNVINEEDLVELFRRDGDEEDYDNGDDYDS